MQVRHQAPLRDFDLCRFDVYYIYIIKQINKKNHPYGLKTRFLHEKKCPDLMVGGLNLSIYLF